MNNQRITGTGYDQEDSYFHEKDQALLAKKRVQLDAQRCVSPSMKCPRCTASMTELAVEHVKIDRCAGCGGIFLDKGELEVLTHAKSGGLFRRFFANEPPFELK